MRIYFDSSALVKRYIQETGTDNVLLWCSLTTELVTSVITLPEVLSAFCRLRRDAVISQLQYRQLKRSLLLDLGQAAQVPVSSEVVKEATLSLEHNLLRGMDSIHIGSALAAQVDRFISSDARQVLAAVRAGLAVEVV